LRRLAISRAGDAEAGRCDGWPVSQKLIKQMVKIAVIGAGKTLFADDLDAPIDDLGKRQQGFGAAEIAAENHDLTRDLNRDLGGNVRLRVVAVETEILEAESKNVLDLGVDPHRR
jgi:hypothetical protein